MESEKTKVVKEWLIPKKLKDIRVFIGFTNFYKTLIEGYGKIITPLINLTKKD